jgi:hypothetical protein
MKLDNFKGNNMYNLIGASWHPSIRELDSASTVKASLALTSKTPFNLNMEPCGFISIDLSKFTVTSTMYYLIEVFDKSPSADHLQCWLIAKVELGTEGVKQSIALADSEEVLLEFGFEHKHHQLWESKL